MIVGKWKPEINPNLKEGLNQQDSNWGDLTLNSDSTFVITGDTSKATAFDTIPGWHAGGELKGTWRWEDNNLLFHPKDFGTPYFLRYRIVQLTKERLVLLPSFDEGDTTKYITYSRKR